MTDMVPIGEYVFDEPDVDMDAEAYAFETERALDRAADVMAVPAVEHKPRWHVTDTGRAEWAMVRLAEARDEEAGFDADYETFLVRAGMWHKAATKDAKRRIRWLTWELEQFGITARTDQSKTIKLVSGAIATRESKPKAVVEDQAAFVDWYRETGIHGWDADLVAEVTVYKVDLGMLRKLVKALDDGTVIDPETGEVIPGLGVDPGGVTAKVEPA